MRRPAPAAPAVAVYAGEEPPEEWDASVFLAGPTPRDGATPSWRPEALALIEGAAPPRGRLVVFVPEPRDGAWRADYADQVAWEDRWLGVADVILFWVPREMGAMPALTTNVEFGRYESSGRVVLGSPAGAAHMGYLRAFARANGAPVVDSLRDAVAEALAAVGSGARRRGGQRDVPLLVWRTPVFSAWLAALEAAGNTLEGARLLWSLRPDGVHPFFWALHVAVLVASEGRVLSNDVVFARTDTASVVAYRRSGAPLDAEVVMVREFRSPAISRDGMALGLPGGSGDPATPMAEVAAAELRDETGLSVDVSRLAPVGVRQPLAAFSAHRQHVFAVELTPGEIGRLRSDRSAHGEAGSQERTTVEVRRAGDLLSGPEADWSALGAIAQAVLGPPQPRPAAPLTGRGRRP